LGLNTQFWTLNHFPLDTRPAKVLVGECF